MHSGPPLEALSTHYVGSEILTFKSIPIGGVTDIGNPGWVHSYRDPRDASGYGEVLQRRRCGF